VEEDQARKGEFDLEEDSEFPSFQAWEEEALEGEVLDAKEEAEALEVKEEAEEGAKEEAEEGVKEEEEAKDDKGNTHMSTPDDDIQIIKKYSKMFKNVQKCSKTMKRLYRCVTVWRIKKIKNLNFLFCHFIKVQRGQLLN
jgi:hypothetical protein